MLFFQFTVKNKFELIFYNEIDASCIPNTHWNGKQILIIYANQTLISELESTNADISILKNTKEAYRLAIWKAYLKKDSEKKSSERAILLSEQVNLLNKYMLSSFSWKITAVFRKIYRLCAQAKNIVKRIRRSNI